MSLGTARWVAPIAPALDVDRVRRDFPALRLEIHGRPLVYLDSAASAQKPASVIEAEARCYRESYANVHRGVHYLSERATEAFEGARTKVARFLGCGCHREVVFVRGTTEAINLVASSFLRPRLSAGDEVLITALEHHSNIVPWQLVCEEKGARLVVAPIDDRGEVILPEFERLLSRRTRLAAFAHVSNALGTINPVREMAALARQRGVPTLVDGAQAVPHLKIDVGELGCDFYAFSAHKMYGPSGVGALWAKLEHLEAMPPYQGGGEMITSVSFARTTFNAPPHKFEAGTPNIAGAIAFGAAVDYLESLGVEAVAAHEHELLLRATAALAAISGVRLLGTAAAKAAVVSFVLEGIHAHDVGTILDRQGIAVRAGHHCAQPVMERFAVPASVRASFGCYNTSDEVDRLAEGLSSVRRLFA
ncbi:MAG: cysteine desulfurase [Thermoanaerobaculia bacterium]